MMKFYQYSLIIALVGFLMTPALLEAKQKVHRNAYGDVEYNATANSPTLPLRQYAPPSSSPDMVYIGTPNYYYYPVPVGAYGGYGYGGGGYGGGPGYGGGGGAGVSYIQSGGKTTRGFWYNTPGGVPYGGGYGGYGYGGGAGFYPPYGGGGIYIP